MRSCRRRRRHQEMKGRDPVVLVWGESSTLEVAIMAQQGKRSAALGRMAFTAALARIATHRVDDLERFGRVEIAVWRLTESLAVFGIGPPDYGCKEKRGCEQRPWEAEGGSSTHLLGPPPPQRSQVPIAPKRQ